mgnify:CR=1 FL=1
MLCQLYENYEHKRWHEKKTIDPTVHHTLWPARVLESLYWLLSYISFQNNHEQILHKVGGSDHARVFIVRFSISPNQTLKYKKICPKLQSFKCILLK